MSTKGDGSRYNIVTVLLCWQVTDYMTVLSQHAFALGSRSGTKLNFVSLRTDARQKASKVQSCSLLRANNTELYIISQKALKRRTMKSIFSSRLAKLRIKSGLSQKQFAGKLNIAPGSMSNYENGIYLPPLEKAVSMAKELHTSLDYLTGLTNINLEPNFWAKEFTDKLSFFQLVKILHSLDKNDLLELMRYMEYLQYKKNRNAYAEGPRVLLVAEEDSDEN